MSVHSLKHVVEVLNNSIDTIDGLLISDTDYNPWVKVMHKVVEDLSYNKEIFERIAKYYLLK